MRRTGWSALDTTDGRLAWPWLVVTALVLPFLFFHWALPFVGQTTIGEDYQAFSIRNQLTLMFSLRHGSWPLYVPGFAGGHSAAALTLGQLYHPISHVCSLMPGYWEGLALDWNTLFRLLTLGGCHAALWAVLRRMGLRDLLAAILALVTVYNLRMLDLFRYGASLESWTGQLLLCASAAYMLQSPHVLRSVVAVAAAVWWTLCSGHPQAAAFGLVGGLAFAAALPWAVPHIGSGRSRSSKEVGRYYAALGVSVAVGIAASSAYLLPFATEFMSDNSGRVGAPHAWTTAYSDTLVGALSSLALPLRADVHGAFGGSSLVAVGLLLPLYGMAGRKIPRAIWAVWAVCCFAVVLALGDHTPLHWLAWRFVPFFSAFRVPGRVTQVLWPLVMLSLAWLCAPGAGNPKTIAEHTGWRVWGGATMTALAMGALGAWSLLAPEATTRFAAVQIRDVPALVHLVTLACGIGSVFALAAVTVASEHASRRLSGLLLAACVGGQLLLALTFGTWIAPRAPTPTLDEMRASYESRLAHRWGPGIGVYRNDVFNHLQKAPLEPFLGTVYTKALSLPSRDSVYAMMAAGRCPGTLLLESGVDSVGNDTACDAAGGMATLVRASFNRLDFDVSNQCQGWLGVGAPYSSHWRASVDGRREHLYRANGIAMAAPVPAGESRVSLTWRSRATVAGMVVTVGCLVTGMVLLMLSFGHGRWYLLTPVVAAGILFLAWWYHGLYTGEHLGTRYRRAGLSEDACANLAFGRRTRLSSELLHGAYPHLNGSGLAVDGDRRPGALCASSGMQAKPFLIVDLHVPAHLNRVDVWEPRLSARTNVRPLILAGSRSGGNWDTLAVHRASSTGEPARFLVDSAAVAVRFLMVQAAGVCRLEVTELEAYGRESPAGEASAPRP